MRGGDVFREYEGEDTHLWVLISDPEADGTAFLVLVSLTSYLSYKDPACILNPEDYPEFIKHPTCVYYEDTRPVSSVVLQKRLDEGKLVQQRSMSPKALAKIRHGAGKSKHTASGCKQILREQGLID